MHSATARSTTMIGMAVEETLRAVDLLGQDDAHERLRQGQRRERPALVGPPETARIEPLDPADQEGDIARSFPVHTLYILRNEWPELQGPL
jgi:hypothetical protein